jgi:hypothetical protein
MDSVDLAVLGHIWNYGWGRFRESVDFFGQKVAIQCSTTAGVIHNAGSRTQANR